MTSSARLSSRDAVLRILAGLQLGGVAGARVDRFQDLGGLGAALDQLLEPVEDARRTRRCSAATGWPCPGMRSGRARSAAANEIRSPLGVARDELLGPVADAALGHVEDAPQADRVLRVGQHPQVGQRVAHLAPLVEPHAADHLVRQPDPQEHVLEHARLAVGAVEDGHVGVADLARNRPAGRSPRRRTRPRRARCRRRSRSPSRRRPGRTTGACRAGPGCGRSPRWPPTGCAGWSGSSAPAGS